jgi:enamine deaminase RidA (YjgF/YER057c/UK114 family)
MAEKRFINPPGLKPLGMYSNTACGRGDYEAQAVQVFENLNLALGGAGATFEDVLKLTIFIKGLTPQARKAVTDVRSRYISHTNPPAATMIGIDRLVEEELLVEIEAVAVVE